MKTVALTMANNDEWLPIAQDVARRFTMLNGIPCSVLGPEAFADFDFPTNGDEDRKPTWLKAYLWDFVSDDVERIIWLDADIVPVRPLPRLPDATFAARLDAGKVPVDAVALPEFKSLSLYFNSGFFAATRKTRPAFERLKTLRNHPVKGPSGGEQSWLNLCIQDLIPRDEIAILPNSISYMYVDGKLPSNVTMIHLAGLYYQRLEFLKILLQTVEAIEINSSETSLGPLPLTGADSDVAGANARPH